MKGYYDTRIIQSLTEVANASYSIAYEYDLTGRITIEKVTGSITRETAYGYDAKDNIISETIKTDGKVITKAYNYDVNGNVTNVSVEVKDATA